MVKPSETPSASSLAPSPASRRGISSPSEMLTSSELESLRADARKANEFGKAYFARPKAERLSSAKAPAVRADPKPAHPPEEE